MFPLEGSSRPPTGRGFEGRSDVMNKRKLMFAIGASAAVVLASCGASESTTSRVKNAALGKPAVLAKGSCDDGEMIEGVDEDDCVISIKLGKATRKAALQVLNTDGDWDEIDSMVAKRGGAKFDVYATDDDGVWLDGQYTYRVFAARSGKLPEFISEDFDVLYGTEFVADDTAALGGEETDGVAPGMQSAPEMQSAMSDIKQPTTKFDDNCSKIFNQVDCALMFRPNKGPDFSTLGKSKWVKMCSTLLSRPEADCEKEFTFATSGGTQGGAVPKGPGLDPAKVSAACAAIGMAEADCRAALQAGPMVALQKFGDKAETFCKTYSGMGCKDMMMKMGGGMPLGGEETDGVAPPMNGQPGQQGNTMQPGQQGTKPPTGGNTMQPGQQPPTPGKG